jgi:hypothetical protein
MKNVSVVIPSFSFASYRSLPRPTGRILCLLDGLQCLLPAHRSSCYDHLDDTTANSQPLQHLGPREVNRQNNHRNSPPSSRSFLNFFLAVLFLSFFSMFPTPSSSLPFSNCSVGCLSLSSYIFRAVSFLSFLAFPLRMIRRE